MCQAGVRRGTPEHVKLMGKKHFQVSITYFAQLFNNNMRSMKAVGRRQDLAELLSRRREREASAGEHELARPPIDFRFEWNLERAFTLRNNFRNSNLPSVMCQVAEAPVPQQLQKLRHHQLHLLRQKSWLMACLRK